MTLVNRDPFARIELHKERVYLAPFNLDATCDWCGSVKHTPKGRPYLFQYRIEPDSITARGSDLRGLFCSKACLNCKHDGRY